MFKRLTRAVLVMLVAFAVVGCSPSGGEPSAAESAGGAVNPIASNSAAATDATASPGALAPAGQGQAVDVTPMSEAELAAQPTGQAPGGTGDDGSGSEDGGQAGPDVPEASNPAGWVVYTDATHGYSVAHPTDFIVREADPARLAGLVPLPAASVYFMNPTTAESALAGTDAPDLEVRIHETGAVASVTDWLAAAGVGTDQMVSSTTLNALPGAQVCASTMIVPQCSTFVAGNDRVYQLRALNQEGEMMAQSFSLVP